MATQPECCLSFTFNVRRPPDGNQKPALNMARSTGSLSGAAVALSPDARRQLRRDSFLSRPNESPSTGTHATPCWIPARAAGCAQPGTLRYARVLGRADICAPRLLYMGAAVPPATFEPKGCNSTSALGCRVASTSLGPAPALPKARTPLEAVRPDGAGEVE